MSGVKTMSVVGSAPAIGVAAGVVGGVILASGVVLVAGAAVATVPIQAAKAYQERARRERERAIAREKEIQQKIADLRAQVRQGDSQRKVSVKIPDIGSVTLNTAKVTASSGEASTISPSIVSPNQINQDTQRKIQTLNSQMPKISAEYQSLVSQQYLDPVTVSQAMEKTWQALSDGNLSGAQDCLQALDAARIEVLNSLKASCQAETQYVQDRLDVVRDRLPQSVTRQLQEEIERTRLSGPPPGDPELLMLHQKVNEFEDQIDRVQEAADHLLNSWGEVGYAAQMVGIDDGDLVLSVETHEGANTEMRVQFAGQQIVLNGPAEETSSCTARTRDMFQLFQQQGYYLEWESLDGQPVPEEWREFYSASSVEAVAGETLIPVESPVLSDITNYENYTSSESNRSEGQRA